MSQRHVGVCRRVEAEMLLMELSDFGLSFEVDINYQRWLRTTTGVDRNAGIL